MANNLKKFQTEAEYTAATLNYPAVSWVVSGDTVHFDNVTPSSTEKIMFYCELEGGGTFVLYNAASQVDTSPIQAISITNIGQSWTVDVNPVTNSLSEFGNGGQFLTKYDISGNTIGSFFAAGLGDEYTMMSEIYIPSQFTTIDAFPSNTFYKVVLGATTPPAFAGGSSVSITIEQECEGDCGIYVPDAAVNTYKAASGWSTYSDKIFPISEYSGNLPLNS